MNSEEIERRDKKSLLNFAYNNLNFIRDVNMKNDEKIFRLFVIMLTYTGLIATAIGLLYSSLSLSTLDLDDIILGSISIVIMITLLIVFFLKHLPKRKGIIKTVLDCFRKAKLYEDDDIIIMLSLIELMLDEQSVNMRKAKLIDFFTIVLILYVIITIITLLVLLF